MIMKNAQLSSISQRLIGQQLTSVLIAIDYMTLKFVKYPLLKGGEFSDGANVDIEEGFEVTNDMGSFIVRKNDDLKGFQMASVYLIALIGQHVVEVKPFANGELDLLFDAHASVRLLVSQEGFDSFDITLKS
jgi:hypothetical protein